MKRLLTFAAALSLASSISFIVPTAASADPGSGNSTGNGDQVAFCQANAASAGISVGECIVLRTGKDDANGLCRLWQGPDGVFFFHFPFPFATFSDCVTFFNTGTAH